MKKAETGIEMGQTEQQVERTQTERLEQKQLMVMLHINTLNTSL